MRLHNGLKTLPINLYDYISLNSFILFFNFLLKVILVTTTLLNWTYYNALFNLNINFIFRLKINDLNVKEMNYKKLDEFIFNLNNDENKQVIIVKYSFYDNNDKEILKCNIDDLNKEYMNNKKYIDDIKIKNTLMT